MRIFFRFCLVLCLTAGSLSAQTRRLATDPGDYPRSVEAMLVGTDQTALMSIGSRFDETWGHLNADQRQLVMRLTQQMESQKLRVSPYFENFFGLLNATDSTGAGTQQMGSLLRMIEQTYAQHPAPQFLEVLKGARQFLLHRAFYVSSYSNLLLDGGSFAFDYVSATPSPAVAAPAPEATDFDPFADFDTDVSAPAFDEIAAQEARGLSYANAPDIHIPAVGGPVIRYESGDLVLLTRFDTSAIAGTSGHYRLLDKDVIGQGGRFDWRVAGLPEVYVELDKYSFAARNPKFMADKVKLHHHQRLDAPAEGILEFESHEKKSPAEARFPRFMSLSSDINVKDVGQDVIYRGGFSLAGQKASSAAYDGGLSCIEVRKGDRTYFRAFAHRFSLGDSLIEASSAYTVMYIEQDSVFHPGRRFFYNTDLGILKLYENRDLYKKSPYINTFHNVEISCDVASWQLDGNSIDFSMLEARSLVPARFESVEFFDADRFSRLQGLSNFHPISLVAGHYLRTKQETFGADELARSNNINSKTLQAVLTSLNADGYVDYNPQTGLVRLNDKTKHYYLAHRKKKDFDRMSIPSLEASSPNGILDLDSRELFVSGVSRFYLSDSLGVYIEPDSQHLRILENRQLDFNGKLNAGSYLAYGKGFNFNYDEFSVYLSEIDSMIVTIENESGVKIRSKLESGGASTHGTLYINDPRNKSGLRDLPQYPIFEMKTPAYVFFDGPDVLNGAYNREVFFTIPPFRIDSMTSSSAASFEGRFISDKIFPEFDEKLQIQPDGKLGFRHQTPSNGYALYGTTGKFEGELSLDSRGLRGKGKVTYQSAVLESDDFVFYQDSLVAAGRNLDMRPTQIGGADYPEVAAAEYHIFWKPYQDSLVLSSLPQKKIDLYGKTATLEGELVLGKTGTSGSGILKSQGALIDSKQYAFGIENFTGRDAYFEVQSDNPLKPAFLSRNVRFNFALKDRKANFEPEVVGEASNEFPYAQYRTSLSRVEWDLDQRTVRMRKPEEADLSTSYFYSLHPDQDSLNFLATEAEYRMDEFAINVSGIPYIKSADAKIVPHGGRATIREGAELMPFEQATVIVDTLNEYHRLTEADIKIASRYRYSGQATYQFAGAAGDTTPIAFSAFKFIELEPDKKRKKDDPFVPVYTFGEGRVSDEQPLTLLPGVLYRGKAEMNANERGLAFDGEIKLDIDAQDVTSSWVRYTPKGGEGGFSIELKDVKGRGDNEVFTGLTVEKGTSDLYITLLSEKKTSGCQQLFDVKGTLIYDEANQEFVVGDLAKTRGETFAGNVFVYNNALKTVEYNGAFHLTNPNSPDPNVQFSVSGLGKGSLEAATYELNAMVGFLPQLPSAAFAEMGRDAVEIAVALGLPPAMEDKGTLLYKIADLVGNRAAEQYNTASSLEYVPLANVDKRLAQGVVITDVNLKWSPEQHAWYSDGRIGVSNIGNVDVNASLEGFVEVKKLFDNDLITVYLEVSPQTWYYFSYNEAKKLSVLASNPTFNQIVSKKTSAGKPGDYHIAMADPMSRVMFIKRFNEQYFGREVDVVVQEPEPEYPEAVGQPAADDEEVGFGGVGEPVEADDPFADKKKDKAKKSKDKGKEKDQKGEADAPVPVATPKPTPPPADDDADGF